MPNFWDRLKAAFSETPEAERPAPEIAVGALLLEAARADDDVADGEVMTARAAIASFFDVEDGEAERILAEAERARADAADIVRFTREAKTAYDTAGRTRLIEAVWRVVLADDETTPDEDAYVRRLAGLLHVTDQDRGAARRRVLAAGAASPSR
ncbi:MAG: TerB family tellurite resistance protein [Pseudomonadota bacterium]